MKKFLILMSVIFLSGCFVAGNFSKEREELHGMNHDDEICQAHPERCINGIPW